MKTVFAAVGALMLAGPLVGCEHHDDNAAGKPTMSVCPQTQTLTHDNFGRSFFQSYCLRCHGPSVTGAARM